MKPTATPMIHIVFDGVEELLSIVDARALYDQLGEALGVFSPTPVVPIQEKTPEEAAWIGRPKTGLVPLTVEDKERERVSLSEVHELREPESDEDVNDALRDSLIEDAKRLAAEHVDETPEPCACQGDMSTTCTDGLQDWEQKLLDLWHKYTDQGMAPTKICTRIMLTTNKSRHLELRGKNTLWIREQLKRLGVDVPDPTPQAECARNARLVSSARANAKANAATERPPVIAPEPKPEPAPEPRPEPQPAAAGPVLEPTPIPDHTPEVTMQLIHVLAAGERLRMDDWRVISVLLGDMGRDSAKLTLPEVTAFDQAFGPWLDHYSSLPPFKRKDIDQRAMAEWKRRAA